MSPPEGQGEVGEKAERAESEPEDFALHVDSLRAWRLERRLAWRKADVPSTWFPLPPVFFVSVADKGVRRE
jgi:hypothetical protein